ncbi:MAG: translation initiation factor IF-2 subunit gamma [Euryarchaeota archaeon]|nr:translation initiation factor IF-2 subunit gamma [Euryarchaeota archaeon]MDE1838012.1 translation initiation factor IF-2 subunit gamma [Euryarchaeota archaeon]MDE1881769.1 translation initiation factor IF-2 subunit gamma [Euryarchaeota archaeon]MDE2046471.1 translation initiation factor IF-2 subunit gamma [Thermoplasmata archaeon]
MKVPAQPEVNIGLVGHVDHGKTTLTHALTGDWTDRHSEEIKRGISIKLGYADAAFYKCPKCPEPDGYTNQPTCPKCGSEAKFLRAVSFVDAPGHETLMATMLSGAAIMNGALLLVAANEKCPQPQTREHLTALEIIGVKHVVVVQNKIDLLEREQTIESQKEIRAMLQGTSMADAPIIPISANHNVNVDALIEAIQLHIPSASREEGKPPLMYVARSFDINRPGTRPKALTGGVLGGSLIQGKIKVGEEIEIRPGPAGQDNAHVDRILTKVTSLMSGGQELMELHPGGLAAIGTMLDPSVTKGDALTGRLVGTMGSLPPVTQKVRLKAKLLDRVVGSQKELKVDQIRTNEVLTLTIGTTIAPGKVTSARGNDVEIALTRPVTFFPGSRVAISRRITAWRLIGYGIVQ